MAHFCFWQICYTFLWITSVWNYTDLTWKAYKREDCIERTLVTLGKERREKEKGLKNPFEQRLHWIGWMISKCTTEANDSRLLSGAPAYPQGCVQIHPTHRCQILSRNHLFPIMSAFCWKPFSDSPQDKVHIPNLTFMTLHNQTLTFPFIPLHAGLLMVLKHCGGQVSSQLFSIWPSSTRFYSLLKTMSSQTSKSYVFIMTYNKLLFLAKLEYSLVAEFLTV